MVYLSTDGIKGKWSAQLYLIFQRAIIFPVLTLVFSIALRHDIL